MNGTSHEDHYQSWLNKQTLKGKSVPQELKFSLDLNGVRHEIADRITGDDNASK